MREILFRGKDIISGEWITGFLVSPNHIGDLVEDNPIRPETVGQFTGLTDKNGTKIFEGDILKNDWGKIFKVFFTTKSCSFMVRCEYTPNEWETGDYRIGEAWCNTIRVIGNIHDSPELLEVE